MKRTLLILLVTFISLNGAMSQTGKKTHLLIPTNNKKKVTTVVSGKTRNYYALDSTNASVIYLRGPGKLRVITRGRFGFDNNDYLNYGVLYSVDGGKTQKFKVKGVGRSKKSGYKNGSLGVPAQSRSFEINLTRGYHSIEFKLKDNFNKVAARYIFTPIKASKKEWISYSPSESIKPVELIIKEDIVKYYRFSMQKPLKIDVNGPTELRILSRIENHYHMTGKINYRIQIIEKDNILNTFQLSSKRSQITTYKKDSTLVPGKAREFAIEVPRGRHQYKIKLLEEGKSTILGRVLIPKSDIKLEK